MSAFDTDHLVCRDIGHAWDYAGDVVRSNEGGVRAFKRTLRCSRCGTIRQDSYRVTDSVAPRGRTYAYPKGYVVKGGMSRSEARLLLYYPKQVRQA